MKEERVVWEQAQTKTETGVPRREITPEEAERLGFIVCTSDRLNSGQHIPWRVGQLYYVTDLDRWLMHTGREDDIPVTGPYWTGWRTALAPGRIVPAARGRGSVPTERLAVAPAVRHARGAGSTVRVRQSSYRALPSDIPTGRTYGADAGERLPRLASGAILIFAILMLLFIVGVAVWVLFADAVPPAQPLPSMPPVSPHLR